MQIQSSCSLLSIWIKLKVILSKQGCNELYYRTQHFVFWLLNHSINILNTQEWKQSLLMMSWCFCLLSPATTSVSVCLWANMLPQQSTSEMNINQPVVYTELNVWCGSSWGSFAVHILSVPSSDCMKCSDMKGSDIRWYTFSFISLIHLSCLTFF